MRIQNSILPLIFAAISFSLLWTGCSKDKYTTKPQLKFIKAKNYNVPFGGFIEFEIEFTDKEGDLTDSIYIERLVPDCPATNSGPFPYAIPKYPSSKNQKGQFDITFVNGVLIDGYAVINSPVCGRPDTTTFRFWVVDKAKNVSDTITTDKPLIIGIP